VFVNPIALKDNVRLKFQNTSDRGNNIYIDDINITGTIVGIDESDDIRTGFTLYPNPSHGNTRLNFTLVSSNHITIEVKDILGRIISGVEDARLSAGDHEYNLPVLKAGIYMIDLQVGNKRHVRKLIVN
jgi:hypothetical protein